MSIFLNYRLSLLHLVLFTAGLLLCAALPDISFADPGPGMDTSCTQLSRYGFTAGLVYCIETTIGNSVRSYTTGDLGLQKFMLPYMSMCAVVAIAMFGIRMMTSSMQEPIKEIMVLGLRLMIGLFFFYQAPLIYDTIAGAPVTGGAVPTNGGIMNQAIGWVTEGTGFAGGNVSTSGTSGSGLISSSCTPPAAPADYGGVQIWQAFDCIFAKIFGAVDPTTTTGATAMATSLLVIVGAALFSGTLGVGIGTLGILAFFTILLLVFRALFIVLLAYLCIGFLSIFAPLIAPLVFFESKILTEKFKTWLGLIISTMFQPVFVIGFLALAIAVDDKIIEGGKADLPNCKPPTYPTATSTLENAPPEGWGQDGTGVCSFTLLFYNNKNGPDLVTFFDNMMENNTTLFNWTTASDPQGHLPNKGITPNPDGTYNTSRAYYDIAYADATGKTNVINIAHQFLAQAGNVQMGGMTRLKQFVPLKQLMLTLLTFIFVNFVMLKLIEVIPQMAADMTISVPINLARTLQLPFEGAIRAALGRGEQGAQSAARNKGLFSGNLNGWKGLGASVQEGARRMIGGVTRRK